MAVVTVRHLVRRDGVAGPRFYWQPSSALRAAGWRARPLVDRHGAPIRDASQAASAAEAINNELDAWRTRRAAGVARSHAAAGTVAALVAAYRRSRFWSKLSARTQRDYATHLEAIVAWAGDRPARGLTPPDVQAFHQAQLGRRRVRGSGGRWETRETPAKAAAAVAVLRLLLEAGRRLGHVADNAAARPGIARGRRREPRLWSAAALAAMVEAADASGLHSMGTAILLNSWIGQREGDVLALAPWSVEDGNLVVRQGKRDRAVSLPVHAVPHLVARLRAEAARRGDTRPSTHLLICELTGEPWAASTFRHRFAAARAAAAQALPECADLLFMELRHTAVTRLHEAGVDALGIAAITGHTPGSVSRILADHYLVRTARAAEGRLSRATGAGGGGIRPARRDGPIGAGVMTDDAVTLLGLRRFLEAYALQRAASAKPDPASTLAAFLEKARPLLRREEATPPARENPPPPDLPARLAAMFAVLREPLQRARARGDLMQVWAVAGLRRNEVRNAGVLAWFLDPNGSHGYGPEILRRFLACAASAAPEWPAFRGDLATARVRTEERPLGSERDRVDIAIDGDDFCLCVEVKIDAPEGQNQLERYLEALREKARVSRKPHVGVIYLSPRPVAAPVDNIAALTWRHVARVLSGLPETGTPGALARQYAQHVRAFY